MNYLQLLQAEAITCCVCVFVRVQTRRGFGLPILTSGGRKKILMLLVVPTQVDQGGGDGVLSFSDEPRHTLNDVRVHQWCWSQSGVRLEKLWSSNKRKEKLWHNKYLQSKSLTKAPKGLWCLIFNCLKGRCVRMWRNNSFDATSKSSVCLVSELSTEISMLTC